MSDVRSEAEYVEAELIEEHDGDGTDTQSAETPTDSASLDTQAIDVVEIIESDPDARVLEEHVAEQEWTREFVIEDDAAPEQIGPDQDGEAADAIAHADAQASAEVGEDAAAAEHAEVAEEAPAAPVAPEPRIQSLPMVKALNAGLRRALADDPRVLLMGEDIGPLGGVFRVTEGLIQEFGDQRVLDTPLAESGIVGTAIGLAMRGYRPVIEIQFDGFIFPAFDQITTQLSRMRNRHEGGLTMPIVIRVPYGGHIGSIEHHQESPEAYFAHTPGLRVVSPSNPDDAYWMIQQAIRSDDPVLFFEPKSRYWPKGDVDFDADPLPLHASRVVRSGTDVTVVGHGAMVTTLLEAADLAAEEGTSIEVIAIRSISPLDYGPILSSVEKTGRLVVAQEASGFVSVGSEIAATVAERAFYLLQAPVLRVSSFETPFPPASLETEILPSPDR